MVRACERTTNQGGEAMDKPTFRDAQEAFQDAIDSGRLSANPRMGNYAGRYMYMGTYGNKDLFKHIDTRKYLD